MKRQGILPFNSTWDSKEMFEKGINLFVGFGRGIVMRPRAHRDVVWCAEHLIDFVHSIQGLPTVGLIFRATRNKKGPRRH